MKRKSFGQQLSYTCFCLIRRLIQLFYPKITIEGLENLPQEPCLLVANHCKTNGPIIGELYIPGRHATWCAAEMMELKKVPAYAYKDFWSLKPGYIRWLYKILSYIIAPLCVCIFNNADTIAVYRDRRVANTFRETANVLCEGSIVTVFPEHAKPHNHIVNDFQEGFVDVARLYYKKSGKALPFVPVYIAPSLRKIYIGDAVYYSPEAERRAERRRICSELMQRITDMATSLPEHVVTPYLNMPKSSYPKNTPSEVRLSDEKSDL